MVRPSKQEDLPAVFLDTKDCHQHPGLSEHDCQQDIDGSKDPTLLSTPQMASSMLCCLLDCNTKISPAREVKYMKIGPVSEWAATFTCG